MKTFLSVLIVLLSLGTVTNAQLPKRPDPQPAPETTEIFNLGMAGYTFNKFDLTKTLETMQRADVKYLCIKDFHLPFKSTDAEIKAFHEKLAEYGVVGYAVGPIYMRSKEEIDNAFEYAKRVGVRVVVGVPTYELLPYVNEKVKEYDMQYAIHLHGPDIELFPDADDVWENVKDHDVTLLISCYPVSWFSRRTQRNFYGNSTSRIKIGKYDHWWRITLSCRIAG